MLNVSNYLAAKQVFTRTSFLPNVSHEIAMGMEGPSLAGILIARIMEKAGSDMELQNILLRELNEHIRGRNGDDGASQANIKLADALRGYTSTGKIAGSTRTMIIAETMRIAQLCQCLPFSGDPVADWVLVRNLLSSSQVDAIRQVGIDAQYLRLLRKGALLNSGLSTLWRSRANYVGAANLVRNALTQEHFTATASSMKGIHVMTMHKSKAKEFSEVIIYEGLHAGKIAITDKGQGVLDQSRLALRVAITRAVTRTTILTPAGQRCPFLY